MFLRELTKSGTITVSYYKDGKLQTCKGRVHNLNLHQQILSVKDENEAVVSLLFSDIKSIH
ncbi:YolD-like family protein [Priestia megaterium]|uniref:YolD-like family protein n=1 Tax=Priestia megaterium TaxID=1404 RepID=UPI0039A2FD39